MSFSQSLTCRSHQNNTQHFPHTKTKFTMRNRNTVSPRISYTCYHLSHRWLNSEQLYSRKRPKYDCITSVICLLCGMAFGTQALAFTVTPYICWFHLLLCCDSAVRKSTRRQDTENKMEKQNRKSHASWSFSILVQQNSTRWRRHSNSQSTFGEAR